MKIKKHLAALLCGALAVCLLGGSALAAEISPSAASLELEQDAATFSFDILLHTDEAFAGAEFGLKPSASDVSLQNLEMLSDLKNESQTRTIRDGVLYFCFYSSSNRYPAGDYTVARITYAYAGTAPRSVQLVSSKIVTVEPDGRTAGDTSAAPFTVSVTRVGGSAGGDSGGGTGGGGTGGNTGPARPFLDVPDGAYYEDAVLWAVENGITSGTSAAAFSPDGVCTRAQAVTFLWRAAGCPAPGAADCPFTDVPADSYYRDAVLWAVETGVTVGTSDTTFSPDGTCTRAQIVTFLWRAAGCPAALGGSTFPDVAAGAYYAAAVAWAVENAITSGTAASAFSPDLNCTRAQIVSFLYRSSPERAAARQTAGAS